MPSKRRKRSSKGRHRRSPRSRKLSARRRKSPSCGCNYRAVSSARHHGVRVFRIGVYGVAPTGVYRAGTSPQHKRRRHDDAPPSTLKPVNGTTKIIMIDGAVHRMADGDGVQHAVDKTERFVQVFRSAITKSQHPVQFEIWFVTKGTPNHILEERKGTIEDIADKKSNARSFRFYHKLQSKNPIDDHYLVYKQQTIAPRSAMWVHTGDENLEGKAVRFANENFKMAVVTQDNDRIQVQDGDLPFSPRKLDDTKSLLTTLHSMTITGDDCPEECASGEFKKWLVNKIFTAEYWTMYKHEFESELQEMVDNFFVPEATMTFLGERKDGDQTWYVYDVNHTSCMHAAYMLSKLYSVQMILFPFVPEADFIQRRFAVSCVKSLADGISIDENITRLEDTRTLECYGQIPNWEFSIEKCADDQLQNIWFVPNESNESAIQELKKRPRTNGPLLNDNDNKLIQLDLFNYKKYG